jgi:tetratricopeptide (TPR) repeat protein
MARRARVCTAGSATGLRVAIRWLTASRQQTPFPHGMAIQGGACIHAAVLALPLLVGIMLAQQYAGAECEDAKPRGTVDQQACDKADNPEGDQDRQRHMLWEQVFSLTKVIRKNPADAAARRKRAVSYAAIGLYDRAVADYTWIITHDGKNVHDYRHRAACYVELSDYERAIADYSESIRLDLGNSDLYRMRGDTHERAGEDKKAIADYSEAIRLDPKNLELYRLRAKAYDHAGAHDNAVADYSEMIRLRPQDAKSYAVRGLFYLNNSDYDKAIRDFTEAIRFDLAR